MQVTFTRGEKKLLKDLKTEYFHFILIEIIRNEDRLMRIAEMEDDNRESDHLVSKYFFVPIIIHLLEYFNRNKNDPEKNIIKSGLKDLNNEIKEMSEEERENERVDKIMEILAYIKQQQKQEGQGLKILTPSQMLSRLPISLAQLEAGNNSEELKNEIRQLLYSLYHSKSITKQVYNDLMKPI